MRGLVDDDSQRRIIADRNAVQFDEQDVTVDVLELVSLVDGDLDAVTTEQLEASVERFRGNFLEDLEFTNFHDFHAWFVAESGRVAQAQERLLKALVNRLLPEPRRALPHIQALVSLSPYNEAYRAHLIRILVDLKRRKEAEQQFQLGMKILTEVNEQPSGAMRAALQGSSAPHPDGENIQPRPEKTVPRPASGDTDPVGRDREMALLAGFFEEAGRNSRARFVLLSGEPGIGKSRLVEWMAALADTHDACLLRASAYETEAIRPFAMWIDALVRHNPDTAREVFAEREGESRDHLFDKLSDYVAEQCAQRPTLLVFDDIHWGDESSAAALHYVARMNRDRPLVGVLGARAGELYDNKPVQQVLRGLGHEGMLEEVALGPLSRDSAKSLIARVAPGADADRLSRDCAGNPLFAIELARAEQQGDSGHSLGGLVRERLARMDAESVEVLRWAAVLSPRIDMDRLVELTGLGEEGIGSALEAAERHGMLTGTFEGPSFTHDLVARGVYNNISPVRRQVMHRRIANHLENQSGSHPGLAAELSHHAINSGDPGLGARALATAGQMCLRFFANDEALSLSRRGLELAGGLADPERVCVSLDLHNVRLAAAPLDDWESAAEKYSELAELALDHGHLPHARLGYQMASYVRWAHGQWSGAREESLQAHRIARGGSEEEHIIGLAETARCLAMLERDLSRADAMIMEATGMAARRGFNHIAIAIASGILRYHENRLEDAEEWLKDGRALCKTAGDRMSEYQANEYLVMIDIQRGDYDSALEQCRELVRIGDKLREGSEAPFARSLEGLCRYAIEDDASALDPALDALRAADAKYRLAYAQLRAALLDLERQRYQQAIRRAGESLECARLLERPTEILLSHVVLQQACSATGNTREMQHHQQEIAGLNLSRASTWAQETMHRLQQETVGEAHG